MTEQHIDFLIETIKENNRFKEGILKLQAKKNTELENKVADLIKARHVPVEAGLFIVVQKVVQGTSTLFGPAKVPFVHTTRTSATTEAARLSRKHPGVVFAVLAYQCELENGQMDF